MTKIIRFVSAIAVFALFLPAVVSADNHEPPPPLTDVWFVVPKSGMDGEFLEAAKKHMAERKAMGESRDWSTFVPVIGKKMNVYQFRSCCFDWADQDGYEKERAEKGLVEAWTESVHQYVDHYHHYIEKTDWEHSHWPDGENTTVDLYGVTTRKWKENPGGGPSEARKKLSKMALENGWAESGHEWLWINRIGGPGELLLVFPFRDYAEMATPDPSFWDFMVEQTGSEEAAGAIYDQMNAGFVSSDFTVWKRVPELSTTSDV